MPLGYQSADMKLETVIKQLMRGVWEGEDVWNIQMETWGVTAISVLMLSWS